jgi:hypothetical protein
LNVELLYDFSLIKEVPQFKIKNLKFKICPRCSLRDARPQRKDSHHRDHRGHGGLRVKGEGGRGRSVKRDANEAGFEFWVLSFELKK